MQKVQQDPTYFDKLTFLTRLVFSRPKEAVDRISRTIGRNVDSLTRRTIAYKAVSFEECVERIAHTLNRRPTTTR